MVVHATNHKAILHAKLFSAVGSMVYLSSVNAAVDRPRAEGARIRMGCLWGLECSSVGWRRRRMIGLWGYVVIWRCGCVWAAGSEALCCD